MMTMITDVPMKAEVFSIEPLTEKILRIFLKPPHYLPYQAGQYLQILMAEEALSYSIANAPLGAHCYELHVRHRLNEPVHQHMLQEIRTQGEVPIFLPLGHCHVGCLEITRPTLLIGQGTGFAPLKAMMEQWLAEGVVPPTVLCWLVREPADWYMSELVEQWVHRVETFQYLPVLMDGQQDEWISKALSLLGKDAPALQVVLAGPSERMLGLRDQLVARGVLLAHVFSDAFI